MARYTDIDKLIAEYDRVHIGPAGGARKLMVEAPIADVAPRAEVAREIFEEIERNVVTFETPYQILHCIPQHYITTLKKKYTEVQK